MPNPHCIRPARAKLELSGFVADYIANVTDQWLLVAPKANSAMLEMFRDRDAQPYRQMVAWAGEFAGKYLTSAVQVLRVTGDKRLRDWLKEFVGRFVALQAEDGYLGPWPKANRLVNYAPNGAFTWDTWGHYHAMLGLLLWNEETNDKAALAAAQKIGDLMCEKFLGHKGKLVACRCSEMNLAPVHSLAILYRKTKEQRYLELALQIVDEFAGHEGTWPDPENPQQMVDGYPAGDYLNQALAGKEFFETPKSRWESLHPIMGLAELYWVTGDEKLRTAFEHLWWSIVQYDRHNTGGFTCAEQAQGDPYMPGNIETCCTIAWMAMSVEMLKLTSNPIVADELELSTLNSVVGMHSPTGRWATYDTPMNGVRVASAHRIVFQSRQGSPELNCCSVNSPRGFGMISDWALMKDKDGLLLNWYGPSKMTAPAGGTSITIEQQTEYPRAGRITIKVSPKKVAAFALKLRIPHWSARTRVKLNGETVRAVKGTYLELDRTWRRGDTIELNLDMSLHVWKGLKARKGLASIYRGPVLLAFDHRYNLEHEGRHEQNTAYLVPAAEQSAQGEQLRPPSLDVTTLKCRAVKWRDWHAPEMLFRAEAANGKTVHLCDYASAGETGTPYHSWLPVKHAPTTPKFTRENPLRSLRK